MRLADDTREIQLLVEAREDVVAEATRLRNRLHADLVVLAPGYEAKADNLVAERHRRSVARLLRRRTELQAQLARRRLARLLTEARELETQLAGLVAGHPLLALPGAGVLTVAKLIGETGDIARFRSADAFAMLTGVAPIPAGRPDAADAPQPRREPAAQPGALRDRPHPSLAPSAGPGLHGAQAGRGQDLAGGDKASCSGRTRRPKTASTLSSVIATRPTEGFERRPRLAAHIGEGYGSRRYPALPNGPTIGPAGDFAGLHGGLMGVASSHNVARGVTVKRPEKAVSRGYSTRAGASGPEAPSVHEHMPPDGCLSRSALLWSTELGRDFNRSGRVTRFHTVPRRSVSARPAAREAPAMGTAPSVPWRIPYAELSGTPSGSMRRLSWPTRMLPTPRTSETR